MLKFYDKSGKLLFLTQADVSSLTRGINPSYHLLTSAYILYTGERRIVRVKLFLYAIYNNTQRHEITVINKSFILVPIPFMATELLIN